MSRPAAIVLQASGPNSLGIIRALAAEGVRVIAADHDPKALGKASRHAHPAHTADPLTEPERFVEDLIAIGRRLGGRPVLFPTHDEAIATIGPREADIDAVLRRPWTDWDRMRVIVDKGGQHAAARRIGFPLPGTADPAEDADPVAAVRDAGMRYPVILKPRYAPEFRRRFRVQVMRCENAEELRRRWEDAAPYGPQIQEVIPGGDEQLWSLGSYRGAGGERIASFTGRKLRQWPPEFGTARSAESRWDPEFADRCHALLDELGFHGISQVEVKRDPRDGRDHLIEVNPRSWLWVSLATTCGVNLPYACYLDALGETRHWAGGHRSNVRWALLPKHLAASVREIRGGRWGAGAFARSLRPPLVDGVASLRDPRPAIQVYGRLIRRGGGGG